MPITLGKADATDDNPLLNAASKMQGKIQQAFLDAVDAVKDKTALADLTEAVASGDTERVMELLDIDLRFSEALQGSGLAPGVTSVRDALNETFTAGATAALESLPASMQVNIAFNVMNPEAVKFLDSYTFNLIKDISSETATAVQSIVTRAFAEGGSPAQQAREIREIIGLTPRMEAAVANYRNALTSGSTTDLSNALSRSLRDGRYDRTLLNAISNRTQLNASTIDKMTARYTQRMVNYRATNIARTESIRASNKGQAELWRQAAQQGYLGKDTLRKWVVSGDDRTCPECLDLEDEERGLDEEFAPGIMEPPDTHPSCRCSLAIVTGSGVGKIHIAKEFNENQPRDEYGRWSSGGGITSTLKEISAKVNPGNLYSSFLRSEQFRHFNELGYSNNEIEEFRNRLEAHTRDATQKEADKDIADNFETDSRFGQFLNDRVAAEKYLIDSAARNADGWYQEKVDRAYKDFEQDKRLGISTYDPEYDGSVESFLDSHYNLSDYRLQRDYAKDPVVYRKGSLDKDVLSTTTIEAGASTSWLSSSSGTTLKPSMTMTLSEARSHGYVPVAGMTSLFGYIGEGEVLFLKHRDTKVEKEFNENQPRDEYGRWSSGGGEGRLAAGKKGYGRRRETQPEKEINLLPKGDPARDTSEYTKDLGKDLIKSLELNAPNFKDACERAVSAQKRVERYDEKLKRAGSKYNSYYEMSLEDRLGSKGRDLRTQVEKEYTDARKNLDTAYARLENANEEIKSTLGEWISKGAVGGPVTAPINFKSDIDDDRTSIMTQQHVSDFERMVGGAPVSGSSQVNFVLGGVRSNYDISRNTIAISKNPPQHLVFHEMGHWFEEQSPNVHMAAVAFLENRTHGERTQKLSEITGDKTYGDSEVGRPDKFLSPYIGRVYPGVRGTEVISMGFEYLSKNPAAFYQKDPDHFFFTIGAIRLAHKTKF